MSERADVPSSPDAAGAEVPSGLPVLPPAAAIIEILALVVLPGVLDLTLPAFPTLNETQPHFFWLPVLLLTLQYGSASGLLAAGTAIVLSSVLGWPEQEIGENHFGYLLRIWLQPVLWLAAAVVLGQLRLRQIERKQALGRAVAELTRQRHTIGRHADEIRRRCDHLECIIAARHVPDGAALLAALGRIQASDAATATGALSETLALAFGRSAVSVLVLRDDALHLAHRRAPPGAPLPRWPVGADNAFYRSLAIEARPLTSLVAGAEHLLDGHGVAAVPILGGGGRPIGAVVLEMADPAELDAFTIDRLAAIATAVAGRLESVPATGASRGETAAMPELEVVRSRSTWRRARWQSSRQRPGLGRAGRKA